MPSVMVHLKIFTTEAQRRGEFKNFLSAGSNFRRKFQIPPHNGLSNLIFSVPLRLCGLIFSRAIARQLRLDDALSICVQNVYFW